MIFRTYIVYQDLYSSIEKDGLLLPASYITQDTVDQLIENFVLLINPEEALKKISEILIQCYTLDSEEIDYKLLNCGSKKQGAYLINNHALMLLQSIFIEKIKRGNNFSGVSRIELFVPLIALINTKISLLDTFKKLSLNNYLLLYFLRKYPCFDDFFGKNIIPRDFYMRWVARYKKVFSFSTKKTNHINLCSTTQPSLAFNSEKYYQGISFLISFYALCIERDDYPDHISIRHLCEKNFFVVAEILQDLSKKYEDLTSTALSTLEQHTYDNPVFIMKDGRVIIRNLNFLIETLTRGAKFLLKSNSSEDSYMNDWGNVYGILMEKYFTLLMRKIFKERYEPLGKDNESDGRIIFHSNNKNFIFLFEFTTQKFRRGSLWEENQFQESVKRIFFDIKKEGMKVKFTGKFFKLAKYIDEEKHKIKGSVVIPVLVTENYIGNTFLLDKLTNKLITNEVNNNILLNSIKNSPIIMLSLDDLETFWGTIIALEDSPEIRVEKFLDWIITWKNALSELYGCENENSLYKDSSLLLQSFLSFIRKKNPDKTTNKEFQEFFKTEIDKDSLSQMTTS